MEVNCSYCEKCDTLWDDKDIENGLCFDCQEPVIKMVARPVVASQQTFAPDVCHGTADGRHLWQNDNNGRYCFACGTRR